MENPALKLHSLLEQAYSECVTYTTPPSFRVIWSEVFQIDSDDTSELIASLSSMFNLFQTTKGYITNHEKLSTARNLYFLSEIEKAIFHINLDGNMNNYMEHLNSETLTALYYIGENMNFVYSLNESTINSEEINSLIKDVDTLLENIINSDLPEDVTALLIKNLNSIRESLISYKVSGIEGMKTALEQTIGSLFINNEIITPVAQDEHVKGMFNIIDKMNTVLSTGVAVKDLVGPIMGLFLK